MGAEKSAPFCFKRDIMDVKITKAGGYLCAPSGHTVMHFLEGQIVNGRVAELAIADGAGVPISTVKAAELEHKITVAPEIKRGPGRPRKQ